MRESCIPRVNRISPHGAEEGSEENCICCRRVRYQYHLVIYSNAEMKIECLSEATIYNFEDHRQLSVD